MKEQSTSARVNLTALALSELEGIVGGMDMTGQAESTNVIDVRGTNIYTTGDFARYDRRLDEANAALAGYEACRAGYFCADPYQFDDDE